MEEGWRPGGHEAKAFLPAALQQHGHTLGSNPCPGGVFGHRPGYSCLANVPAMTAGDPWHPQPPSASITLRGGWLPPGGPALSFTHLCLSVLAFECTSLHRTRPL